MEECGIDDDDMGNGLLILYSFIIFGFIYLYFFIHYLINAILYIKLDPKLYKNNDIYWEIINSFLFRKFSIFSIFIQYMFFFMF